MDIEAFRVRIRDRIAELEAASVDSREARDPVALDQSRQGRLTRMDAMQGQAMARATEARRRRRIEALQGALARIDAGEFGECLTCGEPIAEARLAADPAAVRCIDCASAAEQP